MKVKESLQMTLDHLQADLRVPLEESIRNYYWHYDRLLEEYDLPLPPRICMVVDGNGGLLDKYNELRNDLTGYIANARLVATTKAQSAYGITTSLALFFTNDKKFADVAGDTYTVSRAPLAIGILRYDALRGVHSHLIIDDLLYLGNNLEQDWPEIEFAIRINNFWYGRKNAIEEVRLLCAENTAIGDVPECIRQSIRQISVDFTLNEEDDLDTIVDEIYARLSDQIVTVSFENVFNYNGSLPLGYRDCLRGLINNFLHGVKIDLNDEEQLRRIYAAMLAGKNEVVGFVEGDSPECGDDGVCCAAISYKYDIKIHNNRAIPCATTTGIYFNHPAKYGVVLNVSYILQAMIVSILGEIYLSTRGNPILSINLTPDQLSWCYLFLDDQLNEDVPYVYDIHSIDMRVGGIGLRKKHPTSNFDRKLYLRVEDHL